MEGIFVERLNRFSVVVTLEGREIKAHFANSGRLWELLVNGRSAYLSPAFSGGRKTSYDLLLMRTESGVLVFVDTQLPNALFGEVFQKAELPQFAEYSAIHGEVTVGKSRIDFRLNGPERRCFVEVKSVTLVEGEVGLFPDGHTTRGVRHLCEFVEMKKEGNRAAVVFVVQRPDVACVKPNDEADTVFGGVLREVALAGVEAYGFRCRVGFDGVSLDESIPVFLD